MATPRWIMISLCLLVTTLPSFLMRTLPSSSPICQQDRDTLDCRHRQLAAIPEIPPDVTTLLLDDNNIERIPGGAFERSLQLQSLSLSHNKIKALHQNAFHGLMNLTYLNLGHNNLCLGDQAYPPGVFRPLTYLQTLNIASNICMHVKYPEDAFQDLKNLQTLAVTGLPAMTNPLGYGFRNMTKLQALMFIGTGSSMGQLPCDYFEPFKNTQLKKLSLRNAGITDLCGAVFYSLESLSYLNIACNPNLTHEELLIALKNTTGPTIETLSMDMIGNRGGEVGNYSITGFENTNLKNLKRISIRQIGEVVFDSATMKTLSNAEVLVIGHSTVFFDDQEKNVPEKVAQMLKRSNLVTIALPYFKDAKYSLEIFENEMCKPDEIDLEDYIFFPFNDQYTPKHPVEDELDNEKYSDNLSKGTQQFLRETYDSHQRDDFLMDYQGSYPLDSFEQTLFKHIPSTVQALYLDNCQPSVITDVLRIDINTSNNVGFLNLSTMSTEPQLEVFKNLKKFPNLVYLEAKLCQISELDTFLPSLPNLVSLNLDNNTIESIINPFQNIPNVEIISLQNNRLSTIGERAFCGLRKLKRLSLAHNSVSSTYFNLSELQDLHILDISWNKIPYLSKEFVEEIKKYRSLELEVGNNKLICNCDSLPFIEWVRTTNATIFDRQALVCNYKGNVTTPVFDVDLNHLKISCYKWLMPLCVALGTGLLIGILMLIAYKKRWELCLAYYLVKRRFRIYWRRLKSHLGLMSYSYMSELQNVYDYTAFVAHDNDDYDWVTGEFYDKVEVDWGIRLCIARRDCEVGRPVSRNIVDAIDASKLVICLLTPGFAKSKWCNFELKLALDRGMNTVIFIELKTIPWEDSTEPLQRIVYGRDQNENFLQFPHENLNGQELFWNRLRERLTQV